MFISKIAVTKIPNSCVSFYLEEMADRKHVNKAMKDVSLEPFSQTCGGHSRKLTFPPSSRLPLRLKLMPERWTVNASYM